MTSLAYGLGASCCWAVATILLTFATARSSPRDAAFWYFAFAVVLTAPLGIPALDDVSAHQLSWIALAAVAGALAMLLLNRALGRGQIGVVAPLTALEGPFAVAAGILAGEQVAGSVVAGGLVATAGGMLIALRIGAPSRDAGAGPDAPTAGAALAVGAAALFGISLWALAQQSAAGIVSVLLLRGIGLVAFAPTFARGRLRAAGLPLLLGAAACDVGGNLLFLAGARSDSLAVAAVGATQFGSIAALAGFLLWDDHLSRRQVAGIVALGAGIAIVAAGSV